MTTHRTLVRNIVKCHAGATDEQRQEGSRWYADAHDTAERLFGDADKGAGILAALSPMTPWSRNVYLAELLANGRDAGTLPTLGTARFAASRIYHDGQDWRDVLQGPKVRAFADGIATAGQTDNVCVDRHAADVAYGTPFHGTGHKRTRTEKVTPAEYVAIAKAYTSAARSLGLGPAELQAITWTAHRGTGK